MSRIKGKNTMPEMLVRSILHRLGYKLGLQGVAPPILSCSSDPLHDVNQVYFGGRSHPQ